MLFDTHCHLDFSAFSDLSRLLQQCRQQGITKLCVPSVGAHNWHNVLELKHRFPQQIECALGSHPAFLNSEVNIDSSLKALEALLLDHRQQIAALGEIGLDARFDNDSVQEQVYQQQLELAKRAQLPVIIHCVKRHHRNLPLLKSAQLERAGVIHGFTGDITLAKHYLDLGFKLGIGGAITWPSAHKVIEVVKYLPLNSIVLETDAPDMPLYGQPKGKNTPLNLPLILELLIVYRTESTSLVIDSLFDNSINLFSS